MLESFDIRREAELQRIPAIVRRLFKPEVLDLHKRKSAKRNSKGRKLNGGANDVNLFANDVIVNPIDLQTIKEKAESYVSLDEFQADLQWFVHNFEVLFNGEFCIKLIHICTTKKCHSLTKLRLNHVVLSTKIKSFFSCV